MEHQYKKSWLHSKHPRGIRGKMLARGARFNDEVTSQEIYRAYGIYARYFLLSGY